MLKASDSRMYHLLLIVHYNLETYAWRCTMWISWEKHIPLTRIVKQFMKQHLGRGWSLDNNIRGCLNLQICLHGSFHLELIRKPQFPLEGKTDEELAFSDPGSCTPKPGITNRFSSKEPTVINNGFWSYVLLTTKSSLSHSPRCSQGLRQCLAYRRQLVKVWSMNKWMN